MRDYQSAEGKLQASMIQLGTQKRYIAAGNSSRYRYGINSEDLIPAQCRALQEQLAPMLDYLNKLRHRMQNKGWPLDDPLWSW